MKKAILLFCISSLFLSGCTMGVGAWSTPEEIAAYKKAHAHDDTSANGIIAAMPLGF